MHWGSKVSLQLISQSRVGELAPIQKRKARNDHRRLETLQASSCFELTPLANALRTRFLGQCTHERKRSKIGHASVARASGESLTSSGSQSKLRELCKSGCALHGCENWRARRLKRTIAWSQNHSCNFPRDLDCRVLSHWPLAVGLGLVISISAQILPATVSYALDRGDRQSLMRRGTYCHLPLAVGLGPCQKYSAQSFS